MLYNNIRSKWMILKIWRRIAGFRPQETAGGKKCKKISREFCKLVLIKVLYFLP